MATKSKKSAEVALNSYTTGPDEKGFSVSSAAASSPKP